MLGVIDTPPDISIFTSSSYGKVYKSAFRYTDGSALEMYSGNNTIEDCYFYHIDHTATDLNGLMTTIQMVVIIIFFVEIPCIKWEPQPPSKSW